MCNVVWRISKLWPFSIFSWFIAAIIALSFAIRKLESYGQRFDLPGNIPQPMDTNQPSTSSGVSDRTFLEYYTEYLSVKDNILWDPTPMLRSLIRQCLNNNLRDYFYKVGEMQQIFMSFENSEATKTFFKFIRPTLVQKTNLTRCTECRLPALRNHVVTADYGIIQLNNFNHGNTSTLKELVERHFNDEEVDETNCSGPGCQANRVRRSKVDLLTHTEAFVVSLGREKYNQNTNTMELLLDPIPLGGHLFLRSLDGTEECYMLTSAVKHS